MRFWNVFKFNIKQQYRYGFYLLYLFLAAVYSLIIFLLPASWKTNAIAIIIFFDPAEVGLYFMGGILLLEKSQRLPGAIAVSPIRASEYVAANVSAMTIIAVIVGIIIGIIGGTSSMPGLILGTILCAVLFTMIGIAISTVISDLNQFVLATLPVILILQITPMFYLLNSERAALKYFPTSAIIDMMRGTVPSSVAVTLLSALIILAAAISVKAVKRLWRGAGGAKA